MVVKDSNLGVTSIMTHSQIQYLQLVTNHQALLRGYIHSIAPGVNADDVLQETNTILWKKMDSFELGSNFKAFSCKVARFKTMEALRSQKKEQWLVFDSEIVDRVSERFSSSADATGNAQFALRLCMKDLKQTEQDLIYKRYEEGMTVRALAKQSDRKEGALQQAFFRLHNALRKCIKQKLTTEA